MYWEAELEQLERKGLESLQFKRSNDTFGRLPSRAAYSLADQLRFLEGILKPAKQSA